ncbi:MAG: aminomethyl-transferring glycine dehydrogenase subunit GcvPA [Candidatus Thermoplasmatota archaeon]|nr:aminomethyl-transferring glycine dehydrogenase subunit GcvPA [Candidatus Thermoplasmatota archaeon]
MKFIPNSLAKDEMLNEIGCSDIDELFSDVPKKIKFKDLDLPEGISQCETEQKLRKIAGKNKSYHDIISFIGGGIKPHYIPAVVKAITSRAEFYTSYTPYQAEASQGFLQAMFEYQSIIAELTGMDVANASLYDGATALGEAALTCTRIKKKRTFLVSQTVSWEKKSILKNYTKGPEIKIKEVGYDSKTGRLNVEELKKKLDENVAGVYIENPNFFGIFESEIDKIAKIVHDADALLVVGIDPISIGVVKAPGDYDTDIVIGEGRAFGSPMDFGGSTLGIFACKKEYLRQMPGRVIGMTKDRDGKRAFCMALQTREQHIRRARATSNICTNEGLCTLAAISYLSWLGGNGLQKMGQINFENGQKLAKAITSIDGFELMFDAFHFNEFLIKCSEDPEKINKKLLEQGIQGGLIIEDCPGIENCMLFGITELYSDEDIRKLTTALKEVA